MSAHAMTPTVNLTGHFLIAMPAMADKNFARTLTLVCEHNDQGALGVIVNRPIDMSLDDLFERIDMTLESSRFQGQPVYFGGPVQTDRGFVLHSPDFFLDNSTLPIDDGVSLTATIDILRAIAAGEGPHHALLALGYAGWDAGQLEDEIQKNGWLHCPADPALLFDRDLGSKYVRALRSMGVDLERLSSISGHA